MTNGPQDPFGGGQMGDITAMAIGMHELYKSFVEAGFTDNQATQMIQAVLVEMFRMAKGD